MASAGAQNPRLREQDLVHLIRAHQAPVWRYLRYLGCDPALADDLVQETFLAVWRRPFEDRGEARARGYLRRVALNLFLMNVRRDRVRPAFTNLDAAEAAWASHDREDDGDGYRAALAACLETLTEKARRALALFYEDGAGRVRIAELLGLTVDGVKTLMRRARETLKQCITRRVEA